MIFTYTSFDCVDYRPTTFNFCILSRFSSSEACTYRSNVIVTEACPNIYDYIIIDTPPINTVADAQIVSTYVDGVVLVVKSGDTTEDELNEAIDAVRRAGGNLCGTVLNDLNMKSVKYAYKYKYGGKYGYKYSYSESYEAR